MALLSILQVTAHLLKVHPTLTFVLHQGKNIPRVKIPSIGPPKEPLTENTIEITVPGRADDKYAIAVTITPRRRTAKKVN